jgi:tryptophan 2,3-dioxygenase
MTCPYARFVERDDEPSTATARLTLNGSVNSDALHEILSLTGYGPSSSAKPELKRLPSSDELVTYGNYLQLKRILDSQVLLSAKHDQNKNPVHDEHLFIIIHQTFELWFKQIIWEIDSLRIIFGNKLIDESHMFVSINRLQRCVQIWRLLCDQISILETMTPLDFMEFRSYLSPASGFQSLQFRLVENKLGLTDKSRVVYNQISYKNAFPSAHEQKELTDSLEEPTLLVLIEKWLERTPGLEDSCFNFWERYKRSVAQYIEYLQSNAQDEPNPTAREAALEDVKKTADTFRSLIDEKFHQQLLARSERRMSHRALQGALMIMLYREQPRFQGPYQVLSLLMDIDALITKWRYNHLILVQRQIGNKQGTGGSAGYSYLRSTCSDRYKVFIDLFNLASFLVPREFLPKLTTEMKMRLAVASVESSPNDTKPTIEPHRTSGKNNDKEDGLMSKDDFHPVID